jgi:ABC-type dipeptide/oligopeptide/nickel transport system permease subunit
MTRARSFSLRRLVGGVPARVGVGIVATLVVVAVVGPLVAPHTPTETVGAPFSGASGAFPLGTDYLGRDVLTRILYGGRTVLTLGVVATAAAYLVGGAIGLVAGTLGGRLDGVMMRSTDLLLVFPPLLVLLVLATGAGANARTVVLGVALVQVPAVARVLRAATVQVSVRGFIEAAHARGESLGYVVLREILPNLRGVIAADAGPRLTGSILLIAGVNFLGIGLQPPVSDWALMITENRPGLTFAPLSSAAPALLLALLTIGVNLIADSVARTTGRNIDVEMGRR